MKLEEDQLLLNILRAYEACAQTADNYGAEEAAAKIRKSAGLVTVKNFVDKDGSFFEINYSTLGPGKNPPVNGEGGHIHDPKTTAVDSLNRIANALSEPNPVCNNPQMSANIGRCINCNRKLSEHEGYTPKEK